MNRKIQISAFILKLKAFVTLYIVLGDIAQYIITIFFFISVDNDNYQCQISKFKAIFLLQSDRPFIFIKINI